MNKRRKKTDKGFILKLFISALVIILFPFGKILVLDTLQGIKPILREKILLTSLFFEKPEETFNLYLQNIETCNSSTESEEKIKENTEEIKNEKIENEFSSEEIPSVPEIVLNVSSPAKKEKIKAPMIDPKYRGTIEEHVYKGAENPCFVKYDNIFIRNYTELKENEIKAILDERNNFKIGKSEEPQVLIFHTHATESFEEYDSKYYDTRGTWRSTDNNKNMTAVGDVLEKELKKAGISVIHDYTHHDYPSYNGSYKRSAETVKSYLEKYPSIKLILDLHRDGVIKDKNVIVKSKWEYENQKAAQVMLVCACDPNYSVVPQWRKNFKLATEITSVLERDYNGITRPVYFSEGKYNMNISPGLLVMEFGTNGNTLEEVKLTAEAVGKSMGKWLKDNME